MGERLNYARKQKEYIQDSLAQTIDVSRRTVFNMEKNKIEPQAIVINAVCQVLRVNKEWLTDDTGDMEAGNQAFQSTKLPKGLYDITKELSENEQLFLLDTVESLKLRLNKRQQAACLRRIVTHIVESQIYGYNINELPLCQ